MTHTQQLEGEVDDYSKVVCELTQTLSDMCGVADEMLFHIKPIIAHTPKGLKWFEGWQESLNKAVKIVEFYDGNSIDSEEYSMSIESSRKSDCTCNTTPCECPF